MLEYNEQHIEKILNEHAAANERLEALNARTLPREAWEHWQEDFVTLMRDPLSLFDDLSETLSTAMPIHETSFVYQKVDGEFKAVESMEFTNESLRATVEIEEYRVPVPIFSNQFGWDYRANASVTQEGMGQVASAHREASMYSVQDALEDLMLTGTKSAINGNTAKGLMNSTTVNAATYTGANLNAAGGNDWKNAVESILIALEQDNYGGESPTLYVNPYDWLHASLTRYNDYDATTVAGFVRSIDRVANVKPVRKLAANTILAVVKKKSVLEIPYALPPMIRALGRVDEKDRFDFACEAAASIVIKSDADDHCGIVKLTKA